MTVGRESRRQKRPCRTGALLRLRRARDDPKPVQRRSYARLIEAVAGVVRHLHHSTDRLIRLEMVPKQLTSGWSHIVTTSPEKASMKGKIFAILTEKC